MPLTDRAKNPLWRWLVVGHRWLGIGTCVLFVMWFASGLVMMYVGYPELTTAERLALSQPIEWKRVAVTPDDAMRRAAIAEFPRGLRLVMRDGEPVYRVSPTGQAASTMSAVDGRVIGDIAATDALRIVRRASPGSSAATVKTFHHDQWSVAGTFHAHRPLHLVALNDARGTELYVSSKTGEIVLDSTRRERGWNWVGAVVHWLYFRDLRAHQAVWSQVVMWASGVGIVVALTGLWLGIDRLRIRRSATKQSITPFRGWMAWHHLAGLIGGVFLLTWIFSGWMSMGPPVPWEKPFDAHRMSRGVSAYAGHPGADFPATSATLRTLDSRGAREASFVWAQGRAQIVLLDDTATSQVLDATTGAPRSPSEASLVSAASSLIDDARLVATRKLEREDAYWYSRHGDREIVLPVLRFEFDDDDRTWVHVDPRTGKVVGWLRHSDRVHRWLFNALHSFDFRWLISARPVWDLLLWTLSLAGLVISVSGVLIGWRRLRR